MCVSMCRAQRSAWSTESRQQSGEKRLELCAKNTDVPARTCVLKEMNENLVAGSHRNSLTGKGGGLLWTSLTRLSHFLNLRCYVLHPSLCFPTWIAKAPNRSISAQEDFQQLFRLGWFFNNARARTHAHAHTLTRTRPADKRTVKHTGPESGLAALLRDHSVSESLSSDLWVSMKLLSCL